MLPQAMGTVEEAMWNQVANTHQQQCVPDVLGVLQRSTPPCTVVTLAERASFPIEVRCRGSGLGVASQMRLQQIQLHTHLGVPWLAARHIHVTELGHPKRGLFASISQAVLPAPFGDRLFKALAEHTIQQPTQVALDPQVLGMRIVLQCGQQGTQVVAIGRLKSTRHSGRPVRTYLIGKNGKNGGTKAVGVTRPVTVVGKGNEPCDCLRIQHIHIVTPVLVVVDLCLDGDKEPMLTWRQLCLKDRERLAGKEALAVIGGQTCLHIGPARQHHADVAFQVEPTLPVHPLVAHRVCLARKHPAPRKLQSDVSPGHVEGPLDEVGCVELR